MSGGARWAVVAALALAGCHRSRVAAVQPVAQPEVDLARARELFHHGDFDKAIIALRRVSFELPPGRPEQAEVQYLIAECFFQTGDRLQAAHAFRQVADEYASSDYAPVALLRAGDSNLRLWRMPQLDPTYGETALAIYQELQGRYPGSDAAARAQMHVRQLKEWFAQKAYDNGMFYLRRKAYDPAIIYFKDVIAAYPEAPRVPDALLRLIEIYRAIGYGDELKETCAHTRRYFPQAKGLDKSCPVETGASGP